MKWTEITCPNRAMNYGLYDENEMIPRGFFLHSLGIDLENIPEHLFESCELYTKYDGQYSPAYEGKVHIRDIVGTSHSVYGGKTWIDAFLQEHKTVYHITQGNVTKGKYFHMLKKPLIQQQACISLVKNKQGKYYVYRNGNHRITFYKLMYLADFIKEANNLHNYWLYAEIVDEL